MIGKYLSNTNKSIIVSFARKFRTKQGLNLSFLFRTNECKHRELEKKHRNRMSV
jgi:hypothetical protein